MQSCVIGLQDSMGRRRSRHCTRVRVWVILSGLRVAVGRLGEHNLRRLAPARLVARMDPEAHRRARWQEIHGARSLRRLAILDGRPRRPACGKHQRQQSIKEACRDSIKRVACRDSRRAHGAAAAKPSWVSVGVIKGWEQARRIPTGQRFRGVNAGLTCESPHRQWCTVPGTPPAWTPPAPHSNTRGRRCRRTRFARPARPK
mmetsp:Transcript_26785/g.71682  ORF Transcript_26785/g.71682 Transcript_26785/m.71682 type:complete len:202 (-) Transcript_26785:2041-2646(-)